MTVLRRILRLAGKGEPYRVFFPLGACFGVLGVLLWPAFVYGVLPMYPGVLHSRIMVQGFIFSFMAGFLSSALPHMLEVRGISLGQTGVLALGVTLVVILQLCGMPAAADALFSVNVLFLLFSVLAGVRERSDLPPPGFVLAGLGLVAGATGSLLWSLSSVMRISPPVLVFGKNLLYHGFILFPVIGVGSYMLPKMAGLPNRQLIAPKSPKPSAMWMRRAAFLFFCGVLLLITYAVEAMGYLREAAIARACVIILCMLRELPLYRIRKIRGSIPRALVVSVSSILTGFVLLAIWPMRSLTYLHVVFISGYGLLVLNISARVMLGHSGRGELIFAQSTASRWITGLVLLAMATRVSADLIPRMQLTHYVYAAITWVVITVIWLMVYGPLVQEAPEK